MLFKEIDHFTKTFPARCFCRFYVNEFPHDLHFIPRRVFTQQFQLCRNGISLSFLILAGNTRVNNGFFHVYFPMSFSFFNSDLTLSISASSAAITFSASSSQEKKSFLSSKDSFWRLRPWRRLYKKMARAGPLNSAATASSA